MITVDDILTKLGHKVEDLDAEEMEIYNQWDAQLTDAARGVSIEDVKNYVDQLKDVVETKLTEIKHDSKEDLFLKARLKNLLLLDALLSSPEKKRKVVERQIRNMQAKKQAIEPITE